MSNRGDYRPIYASITSDDDFRALSRDGKLLWYGLKLMLGPSGIDELYDEEIADRSGLDAQDMRTARQELIRGRWIEVEGRVHWIRNGLRFEPNISLTHAKQRAGIERHLKGLPKASVVNRMAEYYGLQIPFPNIETKGSPKPLESLSEGSGIKEKEKEPLKEPLKEPEKEEGEGAFREPTPHPVAQSVASPEPIPVSGFLPGFPVIVELLGRIRHANCAKATAVTLKQAYLYSDGSEEAILGDPSVMGLSITEREQIVCRALVDFQAQREPWNPRLFAGFVRRLRATPTPAVPPTREEREAAYVRAEDHQPPATTPEERRAGRELLRQALGRVDSAGTAEVDVHEVVERARAQLQQAQELKRLGGEAA